MRYYGVSDVNKNMWSFMHSDEKDFLSEIHDINWVKIARKRISTEITKLNKNIN